MIKLTPVKIGETTVPHGLFLAPMAGFTDLEFREICHFLGAEFSVTEMVSAKAVCFGDKKTKELSVLSNSNRRSLCTEVSPSCDCSTFRAKSAELRLSGLPERATGLQLFGHDPSDIETACRLLLQTEDIGTPRSIDINMGCPVKKIVSSGDGSALMKNPELCRSLVEAAVRGAGNVPVTVKIRAGFDAHHKNAVEVALAAVQGGASAVFVHGRTREQFYAPSSDNGIIAAVRDALPPEIPVIGNGDIVTVDDADRMLRETGCDGIMIGRAALGDPWLFGRIAAASEGITLPEPTVEERLSMAKRLCTAVCERYGEVRGVPMCRGRAGHFIKGMRGASEMRDRLCHAATLAEVDRILSKNPSDGE